MKMSRYTGMTLLCVKLYQGHVDGGLFFRLEAEPIAFGWSIWLKLVKTVKRDLLPGEDVASDEACRDIVAAEHTECADDEELRKVC